MTEKKTVMSWKQHGVMIYGEVNGESFPIGVLFTEENPDLKEKYGEIILRTAEVKP